MKLTDFVSALNENDELKAFQDFQDTYYEFQPGDGTRYCIHLMDAYYGGVYVIVNETSLWRYHRGDTLKFLCGNINEYTHRAVWNFMEALQ